MKIGFVSKGLFFLSENRPKNFVAGGPGENETKQEDGICYNS
jgi:hypothetical protein